MKRISKHSVIRSFDHSIIDQKRRGSALLIVLGMLAFMVVSAVGFSVYMRQSRAPSSYLRRNVASRYLVKAALANAIEDLEGNYNEDEYWGVRDDDGYELDDNHFYGIFDDPYPGCGPDNQYAGTDVRKNGDYWLKRVFCPFGPVGEPTSESDALDESKQTPTVPTLTLEALAYLPPAIVDDVRKVSRLTRTACWRPLPSDAGRFAYTAVNVSDCFDINRLQIAARNSGDCRITLASLCTTDATDPLSIGDTAGLKTAAEKWLSSSPDAPYVSLADFAMLNAQTDYSPFTMFIGGQNDQFLAGGTSGPKAGKEANGLFITDTWFPPSNSVNGVTYDLAGGHQPFKTEQFTSTPCPDIFEARNRRNDKDNVGEIFEKNLGIGLACLYDYLDRDSQPLSLCLPTTEATPMVLGISSPAALRPEIGEIGTDGGTSSATINGTVPATSPGDPPTPATAKVNRTAKKMGITKFGGGNVQIKVMAAYPFKRMKTTGRTSGKDFKLRGVMRIFLGQPGMKSRLSSNAKIPSFAAVGDWPNGGNANAVVANGVATFFSEEKSLSSLYSSDVKTWQEAIDDNIPLKFSNMDVQMPIYWKVKEEVDQSSVMPKRSGFVPDNPDDVRGEFNSFGNLSTDPAALRPFDADGNFHAGWQANGPWVMTEIGNAACKKADEEPVIANDVKFRLQVAIWLQVLDGQKVVDMVPASYVDDEIWLNADNTRGRNENINQMGDGMPLLSFSASTDISYKTIESDLQQAVEFTEAKALYAVDPRFNWAPEGWWANAADRVSENTWHDEIENLWGTGGRDRDIFMFVSDQEYMQDIGELQFLPFLQEMNGSGNFNRGDYSPNYHGNQLTAHTTAASAASDFQRGISFLWRTYTAYDNGDGYDPIYALPYNGKDIRIHSGGSGFKLNPYSDDDRVLFAALVGTPFDYYVASTNDDSNVNKLPDISLDDMMNRYSFGRSNLAELKDTEIEGVADAIRDTFQGAAAKGDSNWEKAWENLMDRGEWQDAALKCDENKKFLGVDLQNALHGVDRKFLASFWRECFDNRQQLFLIFVRAEPTAVGGGASGSLSSAQLGARAVALVWRDPSVPTYQSGNRKSRADYRRNREDFRTMKRETPTHRTRVLFYHQFD